MAITEAKFLEYLSREPIKALHVTTGDRSAERLQALTASAEAISGWSGLDTLNTSAKVLATESALLTEVVCFYASYLLKLTNPTIKSTFNMSEGFMTNEDPTLTDFKREAVENHVLNQLALGGFRNIYCFVDRPREAS